MKHTWMRLAAMPAIAAGLLLAQNSATTAPQQPAGPQARSAHHFDMLATALDLTAAQKQQAQAILSAARQSAQPVMQQLKQSRQSLIAAVKAGDNAQIDEIATSQGVLEGQITAIHGKAFAQVYALLSPQQKAKADQMYQNMQSMFAHRFGE
jgi:Spy/CpxP family protein refolding chaperone